jgi:hypothetical protein
MKHYTTPEQTKHLIDIGYPIPAGWGNQDISTGICLALYNDGRELFNYSIAEMIEFMGPYLKSITTNNILDTLQYRVSYSHRKVTHTSTTVCDNELVDALYRAMVDIKNRQGYLSNERISRIVNECSRKLCEDCGCGIPRSTCTSLGTCELHDNFKKTIREYLEEQKNEGV